MTAVQFAYWAQGFFELTDATTLTAKQIDLLERHLQLVFKYEIDAEISSSQLTPEPKKPVFDLEGLAKSVEASKQIEEYKNKIEKQQELHPRQRPGDIEVRC